MVFSFYEIFLINILPKIYLISYTALMENLDTLSVILIFLVFFLFFGILFLWSLLRRGASAGDDQMLDELKRDREDRYKQQESLRNELRENARAMRDDFFRVNKTVDHRLSESSKELNQRLDKSSQVIGNLQKELGKMGEIGSKIENLDKILRAPKGRGSMGEESLEEILRSIFPPNLWERQFPIDKAGVVDAVVKTANGIIPIDSKFPLENFEKLVHTENEIERENAQKDFQKDMKNRINEVAKYIRPENNTLNFAILFLPNENIYYEAAIRSNDIPIYARSKKVLLTGPNTMLYVLQMLFQAYQSQEFSKQARTALQQLSGVKKQAERLDEAVGIVGKHIGNAASKISDVQIENQKLQNQIDKVTRIEGEISSENISEKLV